MKKNHQKKTAPAGTSDELVLPSSVSVATAEIGSAVREGLLALAVASGLQVMTAMMDEDRRVRHGSRGTEGASPGGPHRGTSSFSAAGAVAHSRLNVSSRGVAPPSAVRRRRIRGAPRLRVRTAPATSQSGAWQYLVLRPLPHGHGSLRPALAKRSVISSAKRPWRSRPAISFMGPSM